MNYLYVIVLCPPLWQTPMTIQLFICEFLFFCYFFPAVMTDLQSLLHFPLYLPLQLMLLLEASDEENQRTGNECNGDTNIFL